MEKAGLFAQANPNQRNNIEQTARIYQNNVFNLN
jgi:hypothetical protein